jgi:hypothetical protein
MGWIGFDLDGTLATWGTKDPVTSYVHYNIQVVGDPIPPMVDLCKRLLAEGKDVRIFTARVGPATDEECLEALRRLPGYEPGPRPQRDWETYQRTIIELWCLTHLGQKIPITCTKDFHMYQLYDDRCIQVLSNIGVIVMDRVEELERALRETTQDAADPFLGEETTP